MNTTHMKRQLLASGDVAGLIAANRAEFGGATMMARGYNSSADVVTQTADGVGLNDIWSEFQASLVVQNEARQRIVDLLTYTVTDIVETKPRFTTGNGFEQATEYGIPQSDRLSEDVDTLGYMFTWYDKRIAYTWRYLANATASQVEAHHASVLNQDNINVFQRVMETLFRSDNRVNEAGVPVYAFWNGDGTVPPPYKANTFDGSYTHYRVSGGATITPGDLDEIIDAFKSQGHGPENGTTMFAMVNTVEANTIRTFRFANGARYDFIPAQGQPGLLLPVTTGGDLQVLGQGQAPSTFRGMNVLGTYGNLLILEEEYIPAGYVVALVSGGADSVANPIGIREHATPGLRGLKLVKGRDNDYPLIDSYYTRGFGTGVRQRGAGLIMQIKSSGTYQAPLAYRV